MGVSYKKDGNRVDMGIKIGTVLSSEVWNIQVKSIKPQIRNRPHKMTQRSKR